MDIDLAKEYGKEYSGKIMFLIGIVLLAVGLLFLNSLGSPLSAASLFFGIILVAFGLLIQVGFFYGNLCSVNGLGVFLICLSVVLFAFAIAILQFVEISGVHFIPIIWRGEPPAGYKVRFDYERTYVWLSALLLRVSLVSLIVGLVTKAYYALKT